MPTTLMISDWISALAKSCLIKSISGSFQG